MTQPRVRTSQPADRRRVRDSLPDTAHRQRVAKALCTVEGNMRDRGRERA